MTGEASEHRQEKGDQPLRVVDQYDPGLRALTEHLQSLSAYEHLELLYRMFPPQEVRDG